MRLSTGSTISRAWGRNTGLLANAVRCGYDSVIVELHSSVALFSRTKELT
jgi:hypothetical protein